MGFKFQKFHDVDGDEKKSTEKDGTKSDDKTHSSLYYVAAILIKEGIMTLDSIWPHLSPKDSNNVNDSIFLTEEKLYRKKCAEIAKKAGVVSLVSNQDGEDAAESRAAVSKSGPL